MKCLVLFQLVLLLATFGEATVTHKRLSRESKSITFNVNSDESKATITSENNGVLLSRCPSDSATVKSNSVRTALNLPGVELFSSKDRLPVELSVELSSTATGNATITATEVSSPPSLSLIPGKGGEVGVSRTAEGSFEIVWFAATCESSTDESSTKFEGDVTYSIKFEVANLKSQQIWREWNPLCSRSIEAKRSSCLSSKQKPQELRHGVSGLLSNNSYRVKVIAEYRGIMVAYKGVVVRPIAVNWMTDGQVIEGDVSSGKSLSMALCVRNSQVGRLIKMVFKSTGGDPDLYFTSSVPPTILDTAEPPAVPPTPWSCEIGLYSLNPYEELLINVGRNSVPSSPDCNAVYFFTAFSPTGTDSSFELSAINKGDVDDPLNRYIEFSHDSDSSDGTEVKGFGGWLLNGIWNILVLFFRILFIILDMLG